MRTLNKHLDSLDLLPRSALPRVDPRTNHQQPTMKRSTVSNATTDDRLCALLTLRAQEGMPLRDAILNIYVKYHTENVKSIEFLENLKCFLPVDTNEGRHSDHRAGPPKPARILLRASPPVEGYAAISYPCIASRGESETTGRYHVPDSTVSVRDIVLDRTIRFIRYKQRSCGMIPFWCDQLSMDQNNSHRHELGMQSMDLVYKHCKFAVGHLWVEIKTQLQVDRLACLLAGRIVNTKPTDRAPVLDNNVDAQTTDGILDLLIQITDDPWWSRAWIYQEDYLAGKKMWLLIRHAQGLKKFHARHELGKLAGELVVRSEQFRKYATLFCLALSQLTDQSKAVRSACDKVLQKAGKYNILCNRGDGCSKERIMTVRILNDLNKRNITVPADFLAIAANVCSYNNRILTPKVNTPKISLSLAILTLCLSNGEIIRDGSVDSIRYGHIFNFLENYGVNIHAPIQDGALTFSKHCRLSVSHLSPDGIHTKGILWKLSNQIRPSRLQQASCSSHETQSQRDIHRHGLSDYYRGRLFRLVELIKQRRYGRLADDLAAYLNCDERSLRRDEWPPSFAMDLMAACIVDGIDNGKYLQVARPVHGPWGQNRGTPYRAIFVRDRHELQLPGSTYVFTSWSRTTERVHDRMECRSIAKYVSMEVSVDRKPSDGLTILRSKKWINGLCFFNKEIKSPFVFAWPHLLCE